MMRSPLKVGPIALVQRTTPLIRHWILKLQKKQANNQSYFFSTLISKFLSYTCLLGMNE